MTKKSGKRTLPTQVVFTRDERGSFTIHAPVGHLICDLCSEPLAMVPGLLMYRPSLDVYDALCRECAIAVLGEAREAFARMVAEST